MRDAWCGTWGRGVWGGTGYRLKAGMTNGAVSGKWVRDAACVMRDAGFVGRDVGCGAELDTGSRPV